MVKNLPANAEEQESDPWFRKILHALGQLSSAPQLLSQDFPGGSDGKVSAYSAGDLGSIPGWERSPGEGNGNPL